MKIPVRKLVYGLLLVTLAAGFAVVAMASAGKRSAKVCRDIRVGFAESYRFVTEEDIVGYVRKVAPDVIGCQVDSIDVHMIEKAVDGRSAVLKSQVYVTDDGLLHVDITQRKPFVRFQGEGYGFYADHDGYIFPLQKNFTPNIPVVDGNIPVKAGKDFKGVPEDPKDAQWVRDIIAMLDFMSRSGVWDSNIVQMHVEGHGELVLVPREGSERFIFGSPTDFEEKFSNMEKYYRYVKEAEHEPYTRVNVSYKGQIVCK